jgi:hypothetical protein
VENLRSLETVVPTAVGRGCRAVRPDILCVQKVSHLKIPGEFDGKRDFVEAVACWPDYCEDRKLHALIRLLVGIRVRNK